MYRNPPTFQSGRKQAERYGDPKNFVEPLAEGAAQIPDRPETSTEPSKDSVDPKFPPTPAPAKRSVL